ncbi:MAG: NUDIX domain-containing protein [Planctomycetaceae bacterium]
MTARTTIGIAVVEHEGRYLVGIRPAGVPLAGYAEFPGGKCERGEPPEVCAARECLEEASLVVEPTRLFDRIEWSYPHGPVELHFWLCMLVDVADEPSSPFQWVPRAELASLRFPEANATVVTLLTDDSS